MKVGFALEGGGMKGLFTAGVLDYLLEKDFNIDEIYGVSAGALFGINYKSKQLGRVIRYNKNYCNNKHYMGLYSLLTTGNIMNEDFCFNKLVYELDPFDFETYKNCKTNVYCVVSNVNSGKSEYIKLDDLEDKKQMEFLRATGSMPFVSKKINIDNNLYLDGAIIDSVPYRKMLDEGVDKLVVVLTKPKGYRKGKYSKFLSKLFYHKYPSFMEALANRDKMYNKQMEEIDELEKEGKIFVIRPSKKLDISRLEKDKEKLQALYDLGKEDIDKLFDSLNEFIKKAA